MPIYHSILIIKPGAIGDLLHITPVIRELKRHYPDSRITMLVSSRITAELFRHNPNVAETIVYDRKGAHRSLAGLRALWQQLHAARYDLVLNYQRSNIKTWLLATAAFPCRLLIYHKSRGRLMHAVVNHGETLAPLGFVPRDHYLELVAGPDDESFADALQERYFLAGKTVVAINPGASNRIKCWSTGHFAELADRLQRELKVTGLIVGGGDERDLAEEICAAMETEPIDLLGATTLPQLGALLRRCRLVVSGDTGPLHLATAVGTRVIGLFGAIEPLRTGPVGEGHKVIRHPEVPCVPCNAKTCKNSNYLECMEKITVDEVFAAVAGMLAEGPERRVPHASSDPVPR